MKSFNQLLASDVLRQWLTLAAIVGAIGLNALSNRFPPQGVTVAQMANSIFAPVLIIPANYAFAIWGLIYLGLLAFGIYQLQANQRQDPILRRSSYWLVLASVAQCSWIYLFLNQQFVLSTLAMAGILVALIVMYLRLNIGSVATRNTRWFVHYPISIYLGWISVATVVNVAIALYSQNWTGGGVAPAVWTAGMMVISALLGCAVTLRRHDRVYPLVIVWALVAIAIKQAAMPLIAVTGGVLAIGVVAVTIGGQAVLHRRTDG